MTGYWNKLRLLNFGGDIFVLFFLLTEQWVALPTLGQVIGRAHPLILHFPIVLVCSLPVFPYLLKYWKTEHREMAMQQWLSVVHFFCWVTVVFGLFLSQESGYSSSGLSWHKWLSIAVLGGVVLLQYGRQYIGTTKNYTLASSLIVLLLLGAGHYGANLTHGSDFLTAPLKSSTKEKPPFETADLYADVVFPIMEEKCNSCHNQDKSKGDLILTDSLNILKGGENGPILVRGNISESSLIQNLLLDLEDDLHMPPKGKMQLTSDEIELLKEWVAQGALFHWPVSQLPAEDTLYQLAHKVYGEEAGEDQFTFPAASGKVIASLNDNYRLLVPIADKSPALYARFLSKHHFSADHLQALQKVSDQLVDLNVSNMPINDELLKNISGFKNLQVLNINDTEISDLGIESIQQLTQLQVLSATGTKISPEGLTQLLTNHQHLRRIYIWTDKISTSDIESIQDQFSTVRIIGKMNPFGDRAIALNPPIIDQDRTFFIDTLSVPVRHPIAEVDIRYSEDGSEPDSISSAQYTETLHLNSDATLKFKAFKDGWIGSPVVERSFYRSAYTPDTSWLETRPHRDYLGEGIQSMVDLKAGDMDRRNKAYLGYRNESLRGVFEFETPVALQTVSVSGLYQPGGHIFPPAAIVFYTRDERGNYHKIKSKRLSMPDQKRPSDKYIEDISLDGKEFQHLRIEIIPFEKLPSWHGAKDRPAWVFVDEILFR